MLTSQEFRDYRDTSTIITNQFEGDGIVFSSTTGPIYVMTRGTWPNGPVLKGRPFTGDNIIGTFVVPGTTTPAVVSSFTVTIGAITTSGSTEVTVYDEAGGVLGNLVSTYTHLWTATGGTNRVRLTATFPGESSFTIHTTVTGHPDAAGWNFSYVAFTTPAAGGASGRSGRSGVGLGRGAAAVHDPTCTHKTPSGSPNDPVNCASGNFHLTTTDLSIPGPGPSLDLTRTYNSLSSGTEGIFGYGWASSYSMHLSSASTGDVTIFETDGSSVTAAPAGSGSYQLPTWADSTLTSTGGEYTFVRHQTETFSFDSSGQLTGISDLNGLTTTLSYSTGRLSKVTSPAGKTLTFSYGTNGLVSSVSGPATEVVHYAYDASDDLVSVTDPAGRVTTFGYGTGTHLLETVTEPDGQPGGPDAGDHLTNVYDATGRVTKQTDPMGLVTTYAYSGTSFSAAGGTTTITDPHGSVEVQDYTNGELVSLTAGYGTPVAGTWTYAYGTTLGVTSVTDPNGHTTTFTYDASGNETSSTDALGKTTTTTYNAFDEPLSVTDPMGITTTFTYDTHGNVLTKTLTGAGGSPTETTTYTYAGATFAGEVTKVTDPAGRVTNYAYDTAGDLSSVTTHPSPTASDTTTSVYDAAGRVVCQTSPDATATGVVCPTAGQPRVADTTTWTYNADGQVVSTTNPSGDTTAYAYDANGNNTSVTDALGNVTKTAYDADNRTTSVTQGYGTSSASTTSYAYDLKPGTGSCSSSVAGTTYCTTTTDPNGLVTTDYFNARTQAIETTSPNSGVTTSAYDLAGNLLTQVTPAGKATYGYDADNRLTSITYADPSTGFTAAPNVTYGYNADGQRTEMTDGTGTTTYTYDSLGRLTSSTDGAGSTVSYGYNLDNQVTSITYPGNHTVTQTYDGAGQETSVTDWLGHTTTFSYDSSGNLTTQAYPNSDTTTYAYNATDQVTSISVKKHATTLAITLASFSYTRNADGLVATETDTGVPGPASQTYSYDPLTRLASTSTGSYTYDPAGDPTKLASGATLSYTTGTEQVSMLTTSTATTRFTYNALGDRTASKVPGASTTYSYDQAGRLLGVSGSAYLSTVTAVAAGGLQTCALTSTGHVYCWGGNGTGQLGNGKTTRSSTPVEVAGAGGSNHLSTVSSLSASTSQTCAATSAKNLYCWGADRLGELGNGTTATHSSRPVEVKGVGGSGYLSTVTAVAAGTSWACALTSEGHVYCWGANSTGQLGNGTTKKSNTPVEVEGVGGSGHLSTVTAVAAGQDQTCAVTSARHAYCWGGNFTGELGNGTTATLSSTPVEVKGVGGTGYLSTATAVAAGGAHTCAVGLGHLYCWGDDTTGQLGNGTAATHSSTPVEVVGVGGAGYLSTVTAVSLGYWDTCALSAQGHVDCWGTNLEGQLGNGTTTNSSTPVEVVGVGGSGYLSTVTAMSAGTSHTCAVTSQGHVYCWGTGSNGQLGDGTYSSSSVPVEVSPPSPSSQASNAYNGDGLLVAQTLGGTKDSLTWNLNTQGGNPQLLGVGTYDYVYGPDGLPLEQIKGTTVLYYVHDQLGSTRLLTNSGGTIEASYTYDPYGSLAGSTGSATNPLGFAGAYTEPGSGLLYLVNRWYTPATGQFLSVDPALESTDQPYSYTKDNPVDGTDPSGLATVGICAGAGAQLGLLNLAAGDCLTRTVDRSGEDDIGLVGAVGAGGGVGADVSVGIYYQVSNATNLQQLKGPFFYATVGGELGAGAVVTVFWNASRTIYGIELGVSLGLGATGAIGINYTWVNQFYTVLSANIARGIWDAFNPGLALQRVLAEARADVAVARRC